MGNNLSVSSKVDKKNYISYSLGRPGFLSGSRHTAFWKCGNWHQSENTFSNAHNSIKTWKIKKTVQASSWEGGRRGAVDDGLTAVSRSAISNEQNDRYGVLLIQTDEIIW